MRAATRNSIATGMRVPERERKLSSPKERGETQGQARKQREAQPSGEQVVPETD